MHMQIRLLKIMTFWMIFDIFDILKPEKSWKLDNFEKNKVHLLKILLSNPKCFCPQSSYFLPPKTHLWRSETQSWAQRSFFWDTLYVFGKVLVRIPPFQINSISWMMIDVSCQLSDLSLVSAICSLYTLHTTFK